MFMAIRVVVCVFLLFAPVLQAQDDSLERPASGFRSSGIGLTETLLNFAHQQNKACLACNQLAGRRPPNMKCKLLIRVSFLVTSLVVLPTLSWGAEDGTALYKSKCAVCHGASGEGKPAMKAPALRGTPLTADQITEHTMKGTPNSKAPHNKGISGISDAQAKAISEFVKTLLPGAKSR